ncbi:MAG TPA: anaerobic ribonucleoside-triphosphate reductase [bacterium]|nr:anaerobic ribonucleoside-triphosphate reductase [bacterium]
MRREKLKELLEENSCEELVFKGKCHDCGRDVSVLTSIDVEGNVLVEGGAVYDVNPPSIREDNIFVKCNECFEKDPVLSRYKPCEVYSRVVGYLRPLKQWNSGKQAEWKARKVYDAGKAIASACQE